MVLGSGFKEYIICHTLLYTFFCFVDRNWESERECEIQWCQGIESNRKIATNRKTHYSMILTRVKSCVAKLELVIEIERFSCFVPRNFTLFTLKICTDLNEISQKVIPADAVFQQRKK